MNTNDLITDLQIENKEFSKLIKNMSVLEYQKFNNIIRKWVENTYLSNNKNGQTFKRLD